VEFTELGLKRFRYLSQLHARKAKSALPDRFLELFDVHDVVLSWSTVFFRFLFFLSLFLTMADDFDRINFKFNGVPTCCVYYALCP